MEGRSTKKRKSKAEKRIPAKGQRGLSVQRMEIKHLGNKNGRKRGKQREEEG